MDEKKLDTILEKNHRGQANLLGILQDIQRPRKTTFPRRPSKKVAKSVGMSVARVYSLATFFQAHSA